MRGLKGKIQALLSGGDDWCSFGESYSISSKDRHSTWTV